MTWRDSAECKNHPTSMFFPVGLGRRSPDYKRQIDAAVEVCRTCPVIMECREAGRGLEGVWGGRLNGAPRKPRELSNCGTAAGFSRHRRRGELPCDPCRVANNERQIRLRDSKRAERTAALRAMWGMTG